MSDKKIINFPKQAKDLASKENEDIISKNDERLVLVHTLIEKNWSDFIIKIKETLSSKDHTFFKNTLPLLDAETLNKINKSLNFKEVEKLQIIFESLSSSKNNLKNNIEYILFELKKISLNSVYNYSDQTMTLIKSASTLEILDFLKENSDYKEHISACISNLQLSSLLNEMDEESLNSFISADKSSKTSESFEKKVEDFFKVSEHSPFKQSLKQILKNISYQKEKTIFNMLKDKEEEDYIKDISNNCFPSFLLIHFPQNIIFETTSSIDQQVQIDFLKNLDETQRLNWLNKLAEAGTKKREVLEIELDSTSQNAKPMVSKIEDFYKQLKERLKDERYNTTKSEIISDWLENKV